jgi:hypothetical protein
MTRTKARLEGGSRISDYITLGVVAQMFPKEKVEAVLRETERSSLRHRDLPAHVVVYYIIALALFTSASCREVLRCLLDGVQWLMGAGASLKVAGNSGISQARKRLGWKPMRLLHDEIVRPIATEATKGAWFHHWRLVSLDGSTLDIPDEKGNEASFGRPSASRGESAFPQVRFVSLVENGTHVLFGTRMGPCTTSEVALTDEVLPALKEGMLCLADRGFYSFSLWQKAHATGADLLWRMRANQRLPREEELSDGSFLTTVFPSEKDRRAAQNGRRIRIVEYTLERGISDPSRPPDEDQLYRIGTTILKPEAAPAKELAGLYHERWEIESAFDELKVHLKGRQTLLRSRTPDLIRQEFYGLMMAHFAVRGLMHEAALKAEVDPDRLSFVHAVRVIRRKLPLIAALPPSGKARLPRSRPAGNPG